MKYTINKSKWTEDEKKFLIKKYNELGRECYNKIPNRSFNQVRNMIKILKEEKKLFRRGKYNFDFEDIKYIMENYKKIPTEEITKKLGCSKCYISKIYNKNKNFFISKSDDFDKFREKLNLLMYDLESLKEIRFYEIQFLEEETGLSEYEIQKYIKRYIKEKEKK